MNALVVLLYLFLFLISSRRTTSELLGSCTNMCLCEEKDGSLFVNCEEKGITKLAEIEIPPSQYLELNLLNNGLYKLHVNDFLDFNNLISLHLGFNNIVAIEPGAFNDLRMLKKLHINHNSLEILRENTFMGLEKLEFLQADNNFITTIEANTFSKLNRLKVLILNDNAIDFIPDNIFRFVPLTHLDLRGNQLQTLSYVGFLEHIGRIIELQLEDNKWVCNCDLLQLKIWLENMPQQSTIGDVVCYNPPDLKGAVLRKLKKEMFCITTPSSDLEEPSVPLSLLGTASISDGRVPTKITSLQIPTKETFVLTKSTTLLPGFYCPVPCHCSSYSFSGTLIHCQERNIESVSDLEPPPLNPRKLILAGNIIHRIYKSDFTEYGSLEMLHLGNNQIEIIEEQSFQNLTKLQKLYLNGNHLKSLNPGIFFGMTNIEYLYLEYNAITEISSGTFSVMPKLKVLYLNNNLLKTLPEHIFSGVPLTKVNLKNNQFVNIPIKTVLEELNLVTQIEIQDNPWDCTCSIIGLKHWIQQHKTVVVGEILCYSPRERVKMELRSLDSEDLCPELINFKDFATQPNFNNLTPTFTSTNKVDTILKSLSDYIPLSVLILGLLIVLITAVLCSAGIIVLVLHRRRRYKKKQENGQIRENSPVHIQYSIYGHKTTHHTTERPGSAMFEQRIINPVVQVYQTPPFTPKHSEQDQEEDQELNDSKKLCRGLIEKEINSLQAPSNIKFKDPSTEFISFQDASYLYRNLIEKEQEIQQLGIAEYLRKNIVHLQPGIEVHYPGTHEELKLMESLMYSKSRKVLVEQTKNEYFELKANLHSEPDYLEVLEQQT
ncbi:SLIT and NTRK-like protein 6 [Pseudophryne corroboree]|uniref:SLIT and NTRK-like protein 6 n=1 Tax=Pseudophryne corroboree TaxID=495146 RepID=UPI003081ED48